MSKKLNTLLAKMKKDPNLILPANMSDSMLRYIEESLTRYKGFEMSNSERAALELFVHEWTRLALETYSTLDTQITDDFFRNDLVIFLGMPELEFLVQYERAVQIVGKCDGDIPGDIFDLKRIQGATYDFFSAYLKYEKFGFAGHCSYRSMREDMSEFLRRLVERAQNPDAIAISDEIDECRNSRISKGEQQ
jgi:hypothetical protein